MMPASANRGTQLFGIPHTTEPHIKIAPAAGQEKTFPKSRLGMAVEYAFGQWEWLTTYIGDGRVEIVNNGYERAMRRVAVGRKNWMFTGNNIGGINAAVIYSVIETCVRNKTNPHEYLTDVLVRVGTHKVLELTPHGWAAVKASTSSL